MSWLTKKFDAWATKKQRAELTDFLGRLRAMDAGEIGFVLALAAHLRQQLTAEGIDVSDPVVCAATNPGAPHLLSTTTIQMQKEGRLSEAGAMMVWVHTLRGGARLELRGLVREMWAELERGMPDVEAGAASVLFTLGVMPDITDATRFPIGMGPMPH